MTNQAISQTTLHTKIVTSVLTVATYWAIGILVMLIVMLRFPDLGTLIAQYNQF